MKIIEANAGLLTNFEVAALLRRQVRERRDDERRKPLPGARRASSVSLRSLQDTVLVAEQARAPLARATPANATPPAVAGSSRSRARSLAGDDATAQQQQGPHPHFYVQYQHDSWARPQALGCFDKSACVVQTREGIGTFVAGLGPYKLTRAEQALPHYLCIRLRPCEAAGDNSRTIQS